MNTANLQLEGLLLAAAALFGELKRKGQLDSSQIEAALDRADQGASARATELSDANQEAIRFPIRFLRQALRDDAGPLDYSTIAAEIGRSLDLRANRSPGK
ncbi:MULTISPECIES: hypothetical protein [unclassified Bosea (in: a-proteobacteria)]|jgi:hypothetical protein|uniref:hypothetical protein n=1 Tax=Bosea sp. (in: a-proteobacteria) TaxID=1871050 RepID=UPI00086F6146|nr:hypothetical protein [Bosea sp. (in: a-proteobacteria)]MBN9471804.1 hypothetical protein [Bosea sp. (in: a-proteobacteria)]ODT46889.1 MAG: hypothetical protein ABS59_12515 [Methylobacterium sp. SCN 67-24]